MDKTVTYIFINCYTFINSMIVSFLLLALVFTLIVKPIAVKMNIEID